MKTLESFIPDKEFFSIGEVSSVAQVPAYVLRYWESEFRLLRPARRTSGQRKYMRKDIEQILAVKELLYTKKFTIAGAKKHLLAEKRKKKEPVQLNLELISSPSIDEDVIEDVKSELKDILKLLR